MKREGLAGASELELLARLGARTITDPFEFRLFRAAYPPVLARLSGESPSEVRLFVLCSDSILAGNPNSRASLTRIVVTRWGKGCPRLPHRLWPDNSKGSVSASAGSARAAATVPSFMPTTKPYRV